MSAEKILDLNEVSDKIVEMSKEKFMTWLETCDAYNILKNTLEENERLKKENEKLKSELSWERNSNCQGGW